MSDLDRQASSSQYDDLDYHACPKCGCEMDWSDCWMIDCEEGWYDISEEDPINYAPGTYVRCGECEGKGGWWHCHNKACSAVPTSEKQP
jgi:hypothetical protein